eukprot:ANDGO_03084.mRNA.1 Exocyst complex component EXO70A1
MQTASIRVFSNEAFNRDEQRLAQIRATLGRSAQLTTEVDKILLSFQRRLGDLQDLLRPIEEEVSEYAHVHENIEKTLIAVNRVLDKFEVQSDVEAVLRRGVQDNLDLFLTKLDQLTRAEEFFIENEKTIRSSKDALEKIAMTRTRALQKCADAFDRILSKYSSAVDVQSKDPPARIDWVPEHAVADLSKLSQRLSKASQLSFLKAYRNQRSHSLENTLRSYIRKHVNAAMDDKIIEASRYEKGSHVLLRLTQFYLLLLESERRLANSLVAREQFAAVFKETVSDSLKVYLGVFEEFLSKRAKLYTSEAVYIVFDVVECLDRYRNAYVEVLNTSTDGVSSLAQKFDEICVAYATSASDFLQKMVSHLSHVVVKLPPDGTVHEVTSRTINFLKRLIEFRVAIDYILNHRPTRGKFSISSSQSMTSIASSSGQSSGLKKPSSYTKGSSRTGPRGPHGDSDDEEDDGTRSVYSVARESVAPSEAFRKESTRMFDGNPEEDEVLTSLAAFAARVLTKLDNYLSAVAKQYKNVVLEYLFLMNNRYYIVKAIRSSALMSLVDADFLQVYDVRAGKDKEAYMQACWSKARRFLLDEENAEVNPKNQKKELKARFSGFNDVLSEQVEKQKMYSIPDAELRTVVRKGILEAIIPAYEKMYTKYGSVPFTKNREKYIKFTVLQVTTMLRSLFDEQRAAAAKS